jgi:hypothetical protein
MKAQWNDETLALTPESEQERALLNVLAARHPEDWRPTPPTDQDISLRGAAASPPPGS